MGRGKRGVLIGAVLLAVLALAFWYGGRTPESAGTPAAAQSALVTGAAPETAEEAQAADAAQAGPEAEETAAPSEPPPPSDAPAEAQPSAAVELPAKTPDLPQGAPADAASSEEAAPSQATQSPQEPSTPELSVSEETPEARTCTLSISCAVLLDAMDRLDGAKAELVPSDGWLLPPTAVTFAPGESVFDVLLRTCRRQGIPMEFSNTPVYQSAYIEGIGNLYEFDGGPLSGWMYKVNGVFPHFGCSRCTLAEGDEICWVYTCDQGADVGGSNTPE